MVDVGGSVFHWFGLPVTFIIGIAIGIGIVIGEYGPLFRPPRFGINNKAQVLQTESRVREPPLPASTG